MCKTIVNLEQSILLLFDSDCYFWINPLVFHLPVAIFFFSRLHNLDYWLKMYMHVQYQLLVVILQNGNDTMAERETEFELSYFFFIPY